MFEAQEVSGDRDVYRFRKLDALVRRLGGTHYQIEHNTRGATVINIVVLKWQPRVNGSTVIVTLNIPLTALTEEQQPCP